MTRMAAKAAPSTGRGERGSGDIIQSLAGRGRRRRAQRLVAGPIVRTVEHPGALGTPPVSTDGARIGADELVAVIGVKLDAVARADSVVGQRIAASLHNQVVAVLPNVQRAAVVAGRGISLAPPTIPDAAQVPATTRRAARWQGRRLAGDTLAIRWRRARPDEGK